MVEEFDCKGCGHCCEGAGGIIVTPREIARLSEFLDMAVEKFERQYAEQVNGKTRVRTGESGRCVFFTEGIGCGVHPAKPDVCRAWPFFRGNLVDPVSLGLAKEYCPGIPKDISFENFVKQGLAYLDEARLLHQDTCAHALDMRGITPTENK